VSTGRGRGKKFTEMFVMRAVGTKPQILEETREERKVKQTGGRGEKRMIVLLNKSVHRGGGAKWAYKSPKLRGPV